MTDRDYENLYWEAQEHINKLEGDNATLKREIEGLRNAGKRLLILTESYRENGLPIIFPYADEIAAMKDALLADTKEKKS